MTNAFASSYPISKPTGVCAATGRAFTPGERFVAALCESSERFERRDFSLEAWRSGPRPASAFASWTSVYQPGAQQRPARLTDEEAAELFGQLNDAEAPAQLAFRYILALFLIRRKVLVYEEAREGVLRVRERTPADAPRAPTVEVREVAMSDEALAGAIEQLKELIPDEASSS